jgi:hypothetical protein
MQRPTLTVSDNSSTDVTIPSGETRDYVVSLVGNVIGADLACAGNDPGVTDSGRRTRERNDLGPVRRALTD